MNDSLKEFVLPVSHNQFRALSLRCQNQRDIKTRLLLGLHLRPFGFFVFGLCCFWVLQQPQHRRRLLSLKLVSHFFFCFLLDDALVHPFLSNLIGISKALHISLYRLTSFERAIIPPIEVLALFCLICFMFCQQQSENLL
ncbi:unnamed protein product [Prunus brigantina]